MYLVKAWASLSFGPGTGPAGSDLTLQSDFFSLRSLRLATAAATNWAKDFSRLVEEGVSRHGAQPPRGKKEEMGQRVNWGVALASSGNISKSHQYTRDIFTKHINLSGAKQLESLGIQRYLGTV